MQQKTWFITGISSGLGKALAQTVLDRGDRVIGTMRDARQAQAFNELYKPNGLALSLDVTHHAEIETVAAYVLQKFEHIDVLVNNAGYGLAGAIEETSLDEARQLFDANFSRFHRMEALKPSQDSACTTPASLR